jgi:hypothetical protein
VKAAISTATAVAALAALVLTVVRGVPEALRLLDSQQRRFEGLNAAEREQAFGTSIPTRMDIFDYYRALVRPDDRFYVQVKNEPFGIADKATVVRSIARYYLAPAVEVERPEEATVVLSYNADPGLLPLRYSQQHRAGLQLIFVSRVAR